MYHFCSTGRAAALVLNHNPAVVGLKPHLIQRLQRWWLKKVVENEQCTQPAETGNERREKSWVQSRLRRKWLFQMFRFIWDGLRFIGSGWVLHSQRSMTVELVPISPVSPFSLAHILWTNADDFLDLPDHDDTSQHAFHLLTREGLRRVPHRAVGCDDRLWSHVVCIITPFNALRTSEG